MDLPLVSCTMPTADRRQFLPGAVNYFLAQDYPNKELLILDDGQESVGDLVPKDSRIRYFREEPRRNTGLKRNTLCELAHGDIIAQFDDDDWYAPNRLTEQVGVMLTTGADLSGCCDLFFYDMREGSAWRYTYRGSRPWVYGPTMIYTKKVWREIRFQDVCEDDDSRFAYSCNPRKIRPVEGFWHTATLHGHNGATKKKTPWWRRVPVGDLPGKVTL